MKFILLAAMFQTGAGVAFSVEQNFYTICGVFVATVGLVVATVTWIDKRIDAKITESTEKIDLKFGNVLSELGHVKSLLENNAAKLSKK